MSMVITDTKTITSVVTSAVDGKECNTSVTYTYTDDNVAKIDEATGVLTALKAGETDVTVSTVETTAAGAALTKTFKVTVTALPAATAISIADLNAKTEKDTTNLYSVSGVVEIIGTNYYLVNPETGDSIFMYMITGNAAGISYNKGVLSFTGTNKAELDAVVAGKAITVNGIFDYYASKSMPELYAVVKEVADSTAVYSVTKEATTNGTFVYDKETADTKTYAYGETVTVTCTPAEGYKVGSVSVENAQGTSTTLITDTANVYTFTATCVNKVSVSFIADKSYTSVSSYDLSSVIGGSSYTDTSLFTALDGLKNAEATKAISSISAVNKVYAGNSSSGKAYKGLKFGTSSVSGTFTANFASGSNIGKVVVKCSGWTATDKLTIGDATTQTIGIAYADAFTDALDGSKFKELTFEFTSTDSVVFTFANRGFIRAIEFYSANA